jgi:hypothetical protein
MARISVSIALLALASIVGWPAQPDSVRRTRALVLQHAEFKLTPAALVFDEKGELYAAYRDEGDKKKSSVIWIRVFDPGSGKELRSTQLQAAAVPLPDAAEQFLLSSDNSLLLYSQFHESTFLTILKAPTLQNVSETTSLPEGVAKEFPRVISVDPSDASIFLTAETTNRLNGVDIRLVKLDAHNLNHVLSDATLTNPIPESGYVVDGSGAVWIVGGNGLYRYDPDTGKARLAASIHNQDDIGGVLFAKDHWLLMWSNVNVFGYLYRFELGAPQPERSQRIEKRGVTKVLVSSDQLYGAALCEHHSSWEWNFGAITERTAVIFDAKTLKVLAQVPIEKDLYPELAIWHGGGKIVLATQANSNKLAIYELWASRPTSGAATGITPTISSTAASGGKGI